MRTIGIALALLSGMAGPAHAQTTPSRSMAALIRDGYEIKATGLPTMQALFLQKGSSAFICVFSARPFESAAQAAASMGSTPCAPFQ